MRLWEDREELNALIRLYSHYGIDEEYLKDLIGERDTYMQQSQLEFLEVRTARIPTFEQLEKKELLTRMEVSKFLGISTMTLHRWTKKGVLKAYGIENKVFYKFSEIMTALKAI